ncbi:MAG: DUF2244 domain-containing protein [Pseudomonadota bacterium]
MTHAFDQTIYMDAVLTPNDSLSPRAFQIVMGVTVIMSFLAGMMFLSMGAWPVIGFFGLDALALWFGFRLIRRRTRAETRVRVTADRVTLHHKDGNGGEKSAELPAAFARVELDEPVGPTSWLRIEHGQTAYIIGRFLTPKERESLAKGLRAALRRARAERYSA